MKKLERLDSGFLMKLRDYSKYLCRLMVLCSLKESLVLEILTNKRNNMTSEIWLKIIQRLVGWSRKNKNDSDLTFVEDGKQ